MKKFFCLLLAVIMMISLCGCLGDNTNDDILGEIIGEIIAQNTVPEEKAPEFSFGKTVNNTYSNDFLGISCTLPAEWVFYTDEQIMQRNNLVGDYLDEDVAQWLENATIIYDMFATDDTSGSNININIEKLSVFQLANLDIKQSLEAQFDAIKSAYQNMGYTDVDVKYQKVMVDDKEFDGVKLTAKIQGVNFYGTIFTFRKDNYLATVTVCTVLTDNAADILRCFTVK